MNSKILTLLLLCVSVFLYMSNTNVIENFKEDDENIDNLAGTGSGLGVEMGDRGYSNSPYFQVGPTSAYSPGGAVGTDNVHGPQFLTHARYGLNAARGGDAIACSGKFQNDCRGDSSCVWTNQGCKNNFETLNQTFNVQGYLEKQFQNGTMGADWVKDSKRRESTRPANPNDDNDDGNAVKPFSVQQIEVKDVGGGMENAQIVGKCLNTCLGRTEVPITDDGNKGWFCVSKSKFRNVKARNLAHEDM